MTTRIKLGLLGNNLGRSRAKNLHEMLGDLYGLDVSYQPMDLLERTVPVSIKKELERCRAEGFRGVNVTHPYKRDAFECVKIMPGFPAGLTSVNTVLLDPEEMRADNTDYSGFCRAFKACLGSGTSPGKVLMTGAGGVGVAIAYGLLYLGASELVISEINQETAAELIARLANSGMKVRAAGPDLVEEMRQVDGLVNATPIGMFQYPGSPFPGEGLKNQKWAFDAVYTPENTVFLGACRERGIETLSGFHLFLYQGLDAFEHFTGIVAEAEKVEPLFLEKHPLE